MTLTEPGKAREPANPTQPAEEAKMAAETAKALAEAEKAREETRRVQRESKWFSGFLTPAGMVASASALVTIAGLLVGYFTGSFKTWFDSQSNLLAAKRENLEWQVKDLTNKKESLSLEKEQLDKKIGDLQAELTGSKEQRARTEKLFEALTKTGARFGPWNENYTLEFSPPSGVQGSRVFEPPGHVLALLKEHDYIPFVRNNLLDLITAVQFTGELKLFAKDIEALKELKNLKALRFYWQNEPAPNEALEGLPSLAGSLEDVVLRSKFNPEAVASAISSLRRCESLELELVDATPGVCAAIAKMERLRKLDISQGKVSKRLLQVPLNVRTLTLHKCDLTEFSGVHEGKLSLLEDIWVLGPDGNAAADGNALLWLQTASSIRKIQLQNVKITAEFGAVLLGLRRDVPISVSLWQCKFDVGLEDKLKKHLGSKLQIE